MKEDKNTGQSLRSQFRDWLTEICPGGKIEDYCQVMADSAAPEIMKVRIFSHDYRYSIFVTEEKPGYKAHLSCTATRRKSLAGSTDHLYADLVDLDFSRKTWELIKARILRFELVKITAKAREEQWRKMCSHYEQDGCQFYSEWLQRGEGIKEHKIYELLGSREEGVVKKPEGKTK